MRSTIGSFALAITLTLGASSTLHAQAQSPVRFDIPAQSLADALRAVGSQINLNVMFDPPLVAGKTAPAIKAEMTSRQVLDALLRGTGIKHEFVNETTVVLKRADVSTTSSGSNAAGTVPETELAMQKVENTSNAGEEKNESALAGTATSSQEDENFGAKGIPEILVEGNRSINVDIRRTENDIQPYVIFNADDIENSMASNLEDFLLKRLPMNTAGYSASQIPAGDGNQSRIDLRGMGAEETLVLVNGRRMPGVSAISDSSSITAPGAFQQPDINGIPIAAVERIEVLPSTAGGIYGGGATGGVINIVLKRNYAGMEVSGTYVNTFDSDAAQRRFDVSTGFSLEGGKTHVLTAASFSDANDLLVKDRDFARRGREMLLQTRPEYFFQWGPVAAYTPNIRNSVYDDTAGGYAPLVLDNGRSLGSAYTYIPIGYAGVVTDGGAALLSNAGKQNLELPDDAEGGRQTLLTTPRTASVTVNVRREFGEKVEAFIDLSGNRNNSSSAFTLGPSGSTVSLPADAPNNPFTTPIDVSVQFPGQDHGIDYVSETVNGTAGIVARLPRQWVTALDYGWGRSRTHHPSLPEFRYTLDSALADGTVDIMKDLNEFPVDLSAYEMPRPVDSPTDSTLSDLTLRLAGPLLQLPAGPLSLSTLLERRTEALKSATRAAIDLEGAVLGYYYFPEREQQIDSLYFETLIPLVGAAHTWPGLHKLDVQLSMRSDDYAITGAPAGAGPPTLIPSPEGPFPDISYTTGKSRSEVYTAGLRYMPLESVTVRASYATGFLPPNVAQVATATDETRLFARRDPKRGNALVVFYPTPIVFLSGGRPDLKPELSRSWSAGLILTPAPVPGLRMSLDYTSIDKIDEISPIDTRVILELEDVLPGRIERLPLTTADAALGYTGGVITRFDRTLINIAKTETRALDMQMDYRREMGELGVMSFSATATRQMRMARQYLPTSAMVNSADFVDGPTQWRWAGSLRWSRGVWAASWNVQYIGSQYIYFASYSQSEIEEVTGRYGFNRWPARTYHDLLMEYDFSKATQGRASLLAGLKLTAGIQNVFDTSPPIGPTALANSGYEVPHGDPRLRRYSLSFRKDFR